jgi:hypothetical protein
MKAITPRAATLIAQIADIHRSRFQSGASSISDTRAYRPCRERPSRTKQYRRG